MRQTLLGLGLVAMLSVSLLAGCGALGRHNPSPTGTPATVSQVAKLQKQVKSLRAQLATSKAESRRLRVALKAKRSSSSGSTTSTIHHVHSGKVKLELVFPQTGNSPTFPIIPAPTGAVK